MGNRLDLDRQRLLEPERITHAREKIRELGYEIIYEDSAKIIFEYKGSKVHFYPYSGWHSGKTIKDGRGLQKLLSQVAPAHSINSLNN